MPLDLREREPVRPPGFFDLQLEGVFIGVMLHDVIIHVHQNPERRSKTGLLIPARLEGRLGLTGSAARPSCDMGGTLFTKPPAASIPSRR